MRERFRGILPLGSADSAAAGRKKRSQRLDGAFRRFLLGDRDNAEISPSPAHFRLLIFQGFRL
jgi:hypothetical protein